MSFESQLFSRTTWVYWACILSISISCSTADAWEVINITPPVTEGDVDEFEVSPDGQTIAFVGTLDEGTDQVYAVPAGGGTATRLNPDGVGDVDGGVAFTPDGAGVVSRWGGGDGNLDNQMYLTPIDGSKVATQLSFNFSNVFDPQVSADGSTLYYVDAEDDGNTNNDDLLYATSITTPNTGLTLITPDNVAEIDTAGYAQVGANIVFAGSLPGEGETRFYSTPADGGGTPAEILISNTPDSFTYDIDEMAVTPDNQTIIFVADLTTDGVDELYSMPIGGGVATQLLPTIQSFTDVGPFVISPDGSQILFQADFVDNGVGEAYIVPITGGVPRVLSGNLRNRGYNSDVVAGVDRMAFSPDGKYAYYLADSRVDGVNEIHRARIPEPSAAVLLILASSAIAVLQRR